MMKESLRSPAQKLKTIFYDDNTHTPATDVQLPTGFRNMAAMFDRQYYDTCTLPAIPQDGDQVVVNVFQDASAAAPPALDNPFTVQGGGGFLIGTGAAGAPSITLTEIREELVFTFVVDDDDESVGSPTTSYWKIG